MKESIAMIGRIFTFLFKKRGKKNFIYSIMSGGRILDVGCGNDSPAITKKIRPDVSYFGIDVGDYNQKCDPDKHADAYIITSGQNFAEEISKFKDSFDAVISSHNIEHCDMPYDVLSAMLKSIKSGGALFLSFPSEQSTMYPGRRGTLNFYDDPTHVFLPHYEEILRRIVADGFRIDFARKRYRPFVPFLIGLCLEPFSRLLGRNMPLGTTWALYGFETVIWATRLRTK